MEKVLLVDDEPASLTGLRTCVDWSSLGLEICAEARNGKRAMQLVREHSPAVVIADVRMPFVDGVELARGIQEAGLPTKIVLISAYPNLDTVKSGFRHAAVDFVMKPIRVQELEAAVKNALKRRSEEERVKSSLREKFLVELIAGVHTRNRDVSRQTAWLGLAIPTDRPYLVCVVKGDPNPESSHEDELVLASAGQRLQSLLDKQLGGIVFRSLSRELVALIPLSADRSGSMEELEAFLAAAPGSLYDLGDTALCVGVGTEVPALTHVRRSYETALIALEQRFFGSDEPVYYADVADARDPVELSIPPHELESLRHAIVAGNGEQLKNTVHTLVDDAVAAGIRDLAGMHGLGFRVIMEAADTLIRIGDSGSHAALQAYDAWHRVEEQKTIGGFKDALSEFLFAVCDVVSAKRRTHAQALAEAIRSFIAEHYAEAIAISTIADELEYTDSHICNVFKKETGETINEYLTRYRIDQATNLLRDHTLRLYEICDRVGYRDYKHFVALFKRHRGVSPSEYRDRLVYEEDS